MAELSVAQHPLFQDNPVYQLAATIAEAYADAKPGQILPLARTLALTHSTSTEQVRQTLFVLAANDLLSTKSSSRNFFVPKHGLSSKEPALSDCYKNANLLHNTGQIIWDPTSSSSPHSKTLPSRALGSRCKPYSSVPASAP